MRAADKQAEQPDGSETVVKASRHNKAAADHSQATKGCGCLLLERDFFFYIYKKNAFKLKLENSSF